LSYILDALKKAEKERRHGTVPDPLSIQDVPAIGQRKRLLWPYFLLAAVLVNAALFAWWLVPLQHKKAGGASQQTVVQQNTSKTPGSFQSGSHIPTATAPPSGSATASQPRAESKGKVSSQKSDTTDGKPIAKPSPAAQQNQQTQAKAEPQKKSTPEPAPSGKTKDSDNTPPAEPQPATHASTGSQTVVQLSELPLSVQKSLPAFSITAHLFSPDPTSRMAKVNGKMMREGQELSAGLKLDEITADGVVFSYQNHRFRIGLK
jgi:general secretion pathway protein B